MTLDRDLGVAVVAAWGHGRPSRPTAWDMLAATGVRGLRMLHESDALESILLTDAHPAAVEVLSNNASAFSSDGARTELRDARAVPPEAPFDYVDLDPFGSPVPFLDAAMDSLRPDGLLAVTATDMPVLAGVQPSACRSRYGAEPIRGRLASESGLRILLAYLAARAEQRGRPVRPLLAYVLDHHVRVYLEFDPTGARPPVEAIPGERCSSPPLPPGGPYGPMWVGPLFDREFVDRLTVPASAERPRAVEKLLSRFRDESKVDVPFYYEPNRLAHATGALEPPSLSALFAALLSRGYLAARCHVQESAFRTNAPYSELERIVRELSPAG